MHPKPAFSGAMHLAQLLACDDAQLCAAWCLGCWGPPLRNPCHLSVLGRVMQAYTVLQGLALGDLYTRYQQVSGLHTCDSLCEGALRGGCHKVHCWQPAGASDDILFVWCNDGVSLPCQEQSLQTLLERGKHLPLPRC